MAEILVAIEHNSYAEARNIVFNCWEWNYLKHFYLLYYLFSFHFRAEKQSNSYFK